MEGQLPGGGKMGGYWFEGSRRRGCANGVHNAPLNVREAPADERGLTGWRDPAGPCCGAGAGQPPSDGSIRSKHKEI